MNQDITIGEESFSRSTVERVAEAASIYVQTAPEHYSGFCFWAKKKRDVYAYKIVDAVRVHWAGNPRMAGTYVDKEPGLTPTRLLFVRQLRDYLVGVLALVDSKGPKHVSPTPLDIDSYLGTLEKSPAYPVPGPGTQAYRVLQAMLAGQNDLSIIATMTGARETAASARIRELRSKYGWNIETRRAPGKAQRYTYHIIGA